VNHSERLLAEKMLHDTATLQVSHETICTTIYAMPRGELRPEVIG
jgi:hypothetical protein